MWYFNEAEITGLIQDIYSDSRVSIDVGNRNPRFIQVERGVLQGDLCSPLLFNLCYSPLMRSLSQAKFEHLGYMWGPNADPRSRSWLQFADDMAIIANDVKNVQTLINLNVAWCKWTGMSLRIDKGTSFGMRKQEGLYQQYLPNITVDNLRITTIDLGASFKYLGKMFNFEMDNADVKTQLVALQPKTTAPTCLANMMFNHVDVMFKKTFVKLRNVTQPRTPIRATMPNNAGVTHPATLGRT